MAGEQRLVGCSGADHLEVTLVLVHFARADLESTDLRQPGEFGQQFRRKRCLGPCGINMHHQRQAGRLADRLEVVDHVARTKAEPQPVMRRHDVERLRSSRFRPPGLLDRILNALADNRRNHRAFPLHGFGDNARDFGALAWRKRENLARMAVGHHADDAGLPSKPTGKAGELGGIDRMVRLEWHRHRRDQAVKVGHDGHRSLRFKWTCVWV